MNNLTGKFGIFQLDTHEKTMEQASERPALIKVEDAKGRGILPYDSYTFSELFWICGCQHFLQGPQSQRVRLPAKAHDLPFAYSRNHGMMPELFTRIDVG